MGPGQRQGRQLGGGRSVRRDLLLSWTAGDDGRTAEAAEWQNRQNLMTV